MGEKRQEFEHDLEGIEAKVIELFAMGAEDLPEATSALLTGNNEIMQRLLERDKVISALYPETEQLANREILLQAPVAGDLRFLLSVLRDEKSDTRTGVLVEYGPTGQIFEDPQDRRTQAYVTGRMG